MINFDYLIKFGEERYKNFSRGIKLEDEKLFKDPIDKVSMNLLKSFEDCEDWSSFMYDLYYYSEMIQRVDFFSKYYLHSLTPKARNLDSIKVIFVFNSYIYTFNALKDQIEIYEQKYFSNLDSEKMYLVILNDNRKLQEYYGEFHLMLSKLNAGHALFNIEHVLKGHNQIIKHIDAKKISFIGNSKFIDIPIVMEIKMDNRETNLVKKIRKANENNYFLKRSSIQNIIGDSMLRKEISKTIFEQLLSEILKANCKENINILLYVDNVEDFKSGYYSVDKNSLNFIKENLRSDFNNLLYEFQEFTNVAGVTIWVLFYTDRNTFKDDYSEWFIKLGYMAQEISILAAKYGLAARAMKNYNDSFIKKSFKLKENDFIGYSLALFQNLNYGHSVLI